MSESIIAMPWQLRDIAITQDEDGGKFVVPMTMSMLGLT